MWESFKENFFGLLMFIVAVIFFIFIVAAAICAILVFGCVIAITIQLFLLIHLPAILGGIVGFILVLVLMAGCKTFWDYLKERFNL
jgi:hypothetical protein